MSASSLFRFLLCALLGVATPAHAVEPAPLAIGGYDPVAYFVMSKPVPGKPELEYVWDEQRYRFARPEHLARFKADPASFAPHFGNLCAMALSKGIVKAADPRVWLISKGKLYLFGDPEGPKRFLADPEGALSRAERNLPRNH